MLSDNDKKVIEAMSPEDLECLLKKIGGQSFKPVQNIQRARVEANLKKKEVLKYASANNYNIHYVLELEKAIKEEGYRRGLYQNPPQNTCD